MADQMANIQPEPVVGVGVQQTPNQVSGMRIDSLLNVGGPETEALSPIRLNSTGLQPDDGAQRSYANSYQFLSLSVPVPNSKVSPSTIEKNALLLCPEYQEMMNQFQTGQISPHYFTTHLVSIMKKISQGPSNASQLQPGSDSTALPLQEVLPQSPVIDKTLPEPKQMRTSFTAKFKLEVVDFFEQRLKVHELTPNISPRQATVLASKDTRFQYNKLTSDNVYQFRKQAPALKQLPKSNLLIRRKLERRGFYPKIEELLIKFVEQRRLLHQRVGYYTLRRHLAQIKLTDTVLLTKEQWETAKWSNRFFQNFCNRHGLKFRSPTHQAQAGIEGIKQLAEDFAENVRNTAAEFSIPPSRILNMDETGTPLRVSFGKTLEQVGAKTVTTLSAQDSRDQLTIAITICGDGRQLTPYILFKNILKVPKKEINLINENVQVSTPKSGWMSKEEMLKWARVILKPFCDQFTLNQKVILVLDQAPAHADFDPVQVGINNVIVKMIPAHGTPYVQPCDVGFNGPFKKYFRQNMENYFDADIEWKLMMYGPKKADETAKKQLNRIEFCDVVAKTMTQISQQTIQNAFYKTKLILDLQQPQPLVPQILAEQIHLIFELENNVVVNVVLDPNVAEQPAPGLVGELA